jgi:DNA-binding response OmpR family regulator
VAYPREIARGPALAFAPRMRILVVDDDRDVGEALLALFALAGHLPRWASDAPTALALATEEPPDVAVLDLCLGDDTCLPLLGRLGAARTFVITASLPGPEVRREAERRGAVALLPKSIEPDELLRRVAREV